MDDGKIRPLATEPTAAEQYGVLILFATGCHVVCTCVGEGHTDILYWSLSSGSSPAYTVPFIIGAAWVALCAIPISNMRLYLSLWNEPSQGDG